MPDSQARWGARRVAAEATQRHEISNKIALHPKLGAIPATVIPITIAAFAAYAFAWMDFKGRQTLFVVVVGLMVVPLQMALIPLLKIYVQTDLSGSYLAVWLAHTGFGLPLAIYLLRNYIGSLPRSIIESAAIDGASHFKTFIRLIVPLSVPVIAAFTIFQFLWVWNDFLVALVFLGGENPVMTYTISNMVTSLGAGWHLLTAAAFLSFLVPMIIFFSMQGNFYLAVDRATRDADAVHVIIKVEIILCHGDAYAVNFQFCDIYYSR